MPRLVALLWLGLVALLWLSLMVLLRLVFLAILGLVLVHPARGDKQGDSRPLLLVLAVNRSSPSAVPSLVPSLCGVNCSAPSPGQVAAVSVRSSQSRVYHAASSSHFLV